MRVLVDDAQQLVPEHEPTVRGDAEHALGDLPVGPAHADLQHADAHAVAGRLRNVLDARGVGDAGVDRQREHQAAVSPPSTTRTVPVANSAVAR